MATRAPTTRCSWSRPGRPAPTPAAEGSAAASDLGAAVEAVARDLARQQASDGEGATTLITCQVSGGRDDVEARAVARSVVGSSLLKAAVHGRDPNWGRIAGAIGNARLPEAAVLEAGGMGPDEADRTRRAARRRSIPTRCASRSPARSCSTGRPAAPTAFDKDAVRAKMGGPETLIRIDLGLGDGHGEAFGCDLTEEYVRENSEYST